MLNKTVFQKCFSSVLYLCGVAIDEKKSEMLYQFLKNDFSDEEFPFVCRYICENESLFGKYPEPKMFYSRKKVDESDLVLIAEGSFYLDDSMPEYKQYLIGSTDEEQERIWKWIMDTKYGEKVSKDWIIERIVQFRKPKEIDGSVVYFGDTIKRITA